MWQTFALPLRGISCNKKEVFELSPPGRVSPEGKENNYKAEFGSTGGGWSRMGGRQ
jgi:hypothetical protein